MPRHPSSQSHNPKARIAPASRRFRGLTKEEIEEFHQGERTRAAELEKVRNGAAIKNLFDRKRTGKRPPHHRELVDENDAAEIVLAAINHGQALDALRAGLSNETRVIREHSPRVARAARSAQQALAALIRELHSLQLKRPNGRMSGEPDALARSLFDAISPLNGPELDLSDWTQQVSGLLQARDTSQTIAAMAAALGNPDRLKAPPGRGTARELALAWIDITGDTPSTTRTVDNNPFAQFVIHDLKLTVSIDTLTDAIDCLPTAWIETAKNDGYFALLQQRAG